MSLPLSDRSEPWPILDSQVLATGPVISMVRDRVRTPSTEVITRDWTTHPGAVGVIALDEDDQLVLLQQYRHPLRMVMVEPPAGLLDEAGEAYAVAAARELAEEAQLAADDWRVLVDLGTSPGSTQELIRIFLARGLRPVPRPEGFVVEGEEAHLAVTRAPLSDVVDAILAGRIANPVLIAGALALWARRDDLDSLRPADSPWPAKDQLGGR